MTNMTPRMSRLSSSLKAGVPPERSELPTLSKSFSEQWHNDTGAQIALIEKDAIRMYMEQLTNYDSIRMGLYDALDTTTARTVTSVVVIVSIVILIMETDQNARIEDFGDDVLSEKERTVFAVANAALLAAYGFELLANFFIYRLHFFYWSLNNIDLIVFSFDIAVEVWGELPNIFSAMKVLRFLRLWKIFRKLSEFRELYLILMGILHSVRALLFGSGLIFLMLALYGILAVNFIRPIHLQLISEGIYGECNLFACQAAFDTVMQSALTFMQTIIAGDSWGRLAVPLISHSPLAGVVLFIAFLTINLGLLNTIAAVIVDRQAQARQADTEYMYILKSEEMTKSLHQLKALYRQLDTHATGKATLDDILMGFDRNSTFQTLLQQMDVSREDLPPIFEILDQDKSGTLEADEFVKGLHALKHDNLQTVASFTRHYVQRMYHELYDFRTFRHAVEQKLDIPHAIRTYESRLSAYQTSPSSFPSGDYCDDERRDSACSSYSITNSAFSQPDGASGREHGSVHLQAVMSAAVCASPSGVVRDASLAKHTATGTAIQQLEKTARSDCAYPIEPIQEDSELTDKADLRSLDKVRSAYPRGPALAAVEHEDAARSSIASGPIGRRSVSERGQGRDRSFKPSEQIRLYSNVVSEVPPHIAALCK
eukprot:TRINITY_DN50878_c0_g1_i1.p1 TRINITY_DN50878_c0_g1~~TRINITY_DN50878_c0_g1_i1.p1  ORF type:complete len:680 (+),score=102.05 TRINITY_DN50878_c0_g1_i1:73-2040(+)